MKKESFGSIDILKFVCALLVVVLHVSTYAFAGLAVDSAPPTGKDNPFLFFLPIAFTILRIAVPMFFIASGFLLFKKIKENPDDAKSIVKNYCLRIFKLYLFWFIISIPIMIDKYIVVAEGTLGERIFSLVWHIVFYGGFDGAWYLLATIFSVWLVYALSRKMQNKHILMLAGAFYALAVLCGTYFHLFDGTVLGSIFGFFNSTVPLYHTFLNGTIFVLLGKMFAEKDRLFGKKTTLSLLCTLPFIMYGELLITNYFGLNFATDCFFTLAIFAPILFQFVLDRKISSGKTLVLLRNSSTFIYMFHFVFLYVLYRCANAFGWTAFTENIFVIIGVYIAIVALGIFLCWLTKKLSKKIKVLKYAI